MSSARVRLCAQNCHDLVVDTFQTDSWQRAPDNQRIQTLCFIPLKNYLGKMSINRRCKIFRVVKEVYRGKHQHYSKTGNLIAGLVNLRYIII